MLTLSEPTAAPTDGGWSEWTIWSACTADCGGGIQNRRRACNNPPPSDGGRACAGNSQEWRVCAKQECEGKNIISYLSDTLALRFASHFSITCNNINFVNCLNQRKDSASLPFLDGEKYNYWNPFGSVLLHFKE